MKFAKLIRQTTLIVFVIGLFQQVNASKLFELKVLDKDYLMIHFKDGYVDFVDDGLGSTAYSNGSESSNSRAVPYGAELNLTNAVDINNWLIKSADDANFGEAGVAPAAIYRKTKVNGMSQEQWGGDDWIWDLTKEHFLYLQLPNPLQENATYTIELNENMNSDTTLQSITYDIFNCTSEAIHTNLVGYMSSSRMKSADLYHYLGDGGHRDYTDFTDNQVFIYNVDTEEFSTVGSVKFWMAAKKETNHNLTGSDVWNIDFTGFNQEGTYRLAVEGVGCSQDFEIKNDIYHDPYKLGILGYFYMRIGQDNLEMTPVPRRPLFIQGQSPANCAIYVTDMDPYHPQWSTFASGDKWDAPMSWASFKKAGNPTNPNAIGGHSDALDWDRHLGHVTNIYDLCLAYIISDGALDDDDLRIAESGNGIPDIIDEARNEVDFWLNLRYQKGYSHGLTNPDDNNRLYQADNTPLAAWANSLNSAMLAYCFQIAGMNELKNTYQDSAIIAYNYANNLADPMLDTQMENIRGIDFKMMAAAYLYNLTGDTSYEDVMKDECMITDANSSIYQSGSYNQLWGTAAYLLTKRTVNYPELQSNMKLSLIAKAKSKEANKVNERPSRRGYSSENAYWQTSQDMHRTILAHALTDNPADELFFLDALLLEADWGLGRNPLNMIQMTTATTELEDKRSIENCYTTGRDDGTKGLHPGHTPYLNVDSWGGTMAGSVPSKILKYFYPNHTSWPHASKYINTRFMWAHSEFTPRQTMRGKTLLYAYLYNLSQSGGSITPELVADAGPDQRIVDQDENGKETVQFDGSGSFASGSVITSYKWFMNNNEIASGQSATVELDTGNHIIILEIEDDGGASATDTTQIEIVAFTSGEEADYDFETTDQIDDWIPSNNGEGGTPQISISTDKARSGSQSLKLAGNYINNSANLIKKSGAIDENTGSLVYYVWAPQALVDSAQTVAALDESISGGIQPYLMITGWVWKDTWYNIRDLQGDTWNKITFEIPEDIQTADIIEIGIVFVMQSAGLDSGSIYIDDITFQEPVVPADYDFETSAQFDEWTVENWGSSGGSPIARHSTDIARSGEYSFKIEGNFVPDSENALRKNSPVNADVTSFTYHVWVPQVLVDSSDAMYLRDSTKVGIIQNYLMHTSWQWVSEVYSFRGLKGDDWNELKLAIPENIDPTAIQSIGVSFKPVGVNAGNTAVYIDDIYFNKEGGQTAVENPNGNLANVPNEFKLYHNFPNPFNPETRIKYNLPQESKVSLKIYDIMGHHVKTLINENKNAGNHEVIFKGSDLASGVYLYILEAGQFKDVKKMILLK